MHGWSHCMVPFGLDNMSFQRSERRGRSRATRLNDLIKSLFVKQVRGNFILDTFWLSSEDNALADDLSRGREHEFLARAAALGAWLPGVVPRRHPRSGEVRRLTVVERPGAMDELRQLLDSYRSNDLKDGPAGGQSVRFAMTVPHQRTALTQGLQGDLLSWLESVLDNRLSSSSNRTVRTGLAKWRAVADANGWPHVITTDDPNRGGKMTALMHHLVEDTELVWGSIQNYLWGVRTWMKLQHQADPVYGVEHWDMLQQSCEVLTAVPSEPRKEIPLGVVRAILEALDPSVEWEAQFGFFMLTLLFTFSRSECPCPKAFTGEQSFDPEQHWQVGDFSFEIQEMVKCIAVRFKKVKQDPRVQRPQARGADGRSGDWTYVGDIPDSIFSIVTWYQRLLRCWGRQRAKDEPMFLARDRVRAYTYPAAMSDLETMLARVGCAERYGLHTLRVSGYNWSKRGNGVDLTVAHGLWMSSAHSRYERFPMSDVVQIPANMVGEHPDVMPPAGRPAAQARPSGRVQRGAHARARAAHDDGEELAEPAAAAGSPPGGAHTSNCSPPEPPPADRETRRAAQRVAAQAAQRVAAAAARGAPVRPRQRRR